MEFETNMTAFQKMLESVRASNPDLISQQYAAQLTQEFDSEMNQIKADATAEGQAIGFKEGYEEGKRAAADEAKIKLDQVVAKLDAESTEKLTKILEMIDEDHTKKIDQIFAKLTAERDAAVNTALAEQDADYAEKFRIAMECMDEKHTQMITEAVNTIDAKHTTKLTNLYKALDKKHAQMITEAVNAVDEANAKKLVELANIYKANQEKAVKIVSEEITKKFKTQLKKKQLAFESKLKEKDTALANEQNHKLSLLAESVEKYLNYALENYIPKKTLVSEAKYNAAIKAIEKVTDVLKVNAIIQESKDGIFADYESKIASEKEAQQKLINENIQLKATVDKQEAQIVLEKKCKECTPSEAKFLRAYFKGAKSAKVIEESVEEARGAYKKLQAERRQTLIEESSKKVSTKPESVVTESKKEPKVKESPKKIVSEEKAPQKQVTEQSVIDIYAEILNRKDS